MLLQIIRKVNLSKIYQKFRFENNIKHSINEYDSRISHRRDNKGLDSEGKTDQSSKNSKLSSIPFPLTMQDAEKRIKEQDDLSSILTPINFKISHHRESYKSNSSKKHTNKVYESPLSK